MAPPTPTSHSYEPWGTAKALLENRSDEIVLSGPAGTGKSRAALEKVNLMCLLNPGMRALFVRKTLASLASTGLVTFREKVGKEGLKYRVIDYFGGSNAEPAQYRYSNGSVIVIGGMDKATKIMSSEYDVIYVQEATELTEDDWEALTTRLRNGVVSFQQLIADCNPDRPTHWLKVRSDKGATLMLHSRHEDNPLLYTRDGVLTETGASYMAKLDALTGVRKERLRYGRWAASDGLVYDEYDPAVHLLDQFEIPAEWPRFWAVDFGFTNPFVCQFWAQDPDGRLYLYRELYMTRRTVDQHAATIAKAVLNRPKQTQDGTWIGEWKEPRPQAIVCDHDAEGRVVLQRALGLPTQPADKKVTEGIQAVARRIRPADDGKVRVYFLRDALIERDRELEGAKLPCSTIDEISGYVWDTTTGDRLKDAPRKQDDHGMDAMRYLVMHRDMQPRTRVRSFRY